MKTRPETIRIDDLRAKTDRQLIAFINKRLDDGIRLDCDAAEKIYREVSKLLPVVYGATRAEREMMELKLTLLSETLRMSCASVA